MKKYLLKVFCYAIIAWGILCLADEVVTGGLRKTEHKDFALMNKVFSGDLNNEVLILGGSDAGQHFSTMILDSILEKNTYNLALVGHNFFLQKAVFDSYIKNNNNVYPEVVIQVVNIGLLSRREDLYNYQLFLPYVSDANIRESTAEYKGLDWADYYVPFVRYSGEMELIKVGLFEYLGIKKYTNQKYKGYLAHDRPWSETSYQDLVSKYPNTIELHEPSVDLFDEYIKELKANGTRVILVQSPYYLEAQKQFTNRDDVMNIFKEISQKHQVPYYDYSTEPFSSDKNNFYDYAHLNKAKSISFSKLIGTELKPILATDL